MTKKKDEIEEIKDDLVNLKIRIERLEASINPTYSDGDLLEKATKIVQKYDRASASLLQRRLAIGYARAARLIDQLEASGVIGPTDGSSAPREVFKRKLN